MRKVLITNGDNLRALMFLRAVQNKKDIELHVAAERKFNACFFSKHCKHKLINPNPKKHPKEFLSTILSYVIKNNIDVLIPSNADELELILKNRNIFPKSLDIPFMDYTTFKMVKDKWGFYKLAKALKVPVPITTKITKQSDLKNIKFPAIIKITKGAGSKGVLKADNQEELLKKYEKIRKEYPNQEILIQEYLNGDNYCVASLCKNGKILSTSAYKSTRQYPIEHGTSTSRTSVYEPKMMKEAEKILTKLKWHGIAQFDIIKKGNNFYFLEMNPRLYTSLNITLKSGLNYPYALCKMNENITFPKKYKTGVKTRIILADKLVFLKSIFRKNNYPFIEYVNFKDTTLDDISLADPLPTIPLIVKLLRGKLV